MERKEDIAQKIVELYVKKKKSSAEVAKILSCSEGKINYWLKKSKVKKRKISEAVYIKNNPNGDPFRLKPPRTVKEAVLFGMGVGLFWGEGTKADKSSLRLGNSDPKLLLVFIKFLVKFFKIKKKDLRFHLHLFSDIDEKEAIIFWIKELKVDRKQFYKPYVTISGKLGNYKVKSKYGVLTLYYCNKKLRNLIVQLLPL